MTERRRRFIFLVVAGVAVIAAASVLGPLTHGPTAISRKADQRLAATAAAAGEQTPAEPPEGTEPPNPPSGAGQRNRAAQVTRRFLNAFLRYQAGRLDPATRTALHRTSTRALADKLVGRPPRPVGTGFLRGQVGPIAVVGPFRGRMKVVARVLYPGAQAGLLELELEKHRRAFSVSRFYP